MRQPKPRKIHPFAYKTERNIEIYLKHTRDGISYADIGREYGLTRSRIRQLVMCESRRYYKRRVARAALEKFKVVGSG